MRSEPDEAPGLEAGEPDAGALDPGRARASLASCADPFLIGVRHHSSACASAVEPLLDGFRPTAVLLELPPEFASWLPWLGHADARAPLALGAVGAGLSFYPFADFSPELQVVRWCVRNGVPCVPFDLPLGARGGAVDLPERPTGPSLHDALGRLVDAGDGEATWDHLVEAPALTDDPEAVRVAALLYGWALRADRGSPPRGSDLSREAHMRARLAEQRTPGARLAAVVGAFHAAALLDDPAVDPLPRVPEPTGAGGPPIVTSLLAYGFEQLDSRSGYPAGIRDPRWHQRVLEARRAGTPVDAVADAVVVEICREMREERHVAGTPDATEVLRLARGLASLRGLRAMGRRELLEGLTTALGRGELLGRGRVLARAAERVLVGRARGRLAHGTPRSGLLPHVESLFAALRLPGPDDAPPTDPLRLDPLRSELDRQRHVALRRTLAANVVYAEPRDTEEHTLGAVWTVGWTAGTEATLTAAGLRGITLEQAAAGALRATLTELEREEKLTAGIWIDVLDTAAQAALHDEVHRAVDAMRGAVIGEAGLSDLVRAIGVLERIAAGHVPGCPVPGPEPRAAGSGPGAVPTLDLARIGVEGLRDELLAACVRAVDGLAGSEDLADAVALGALARVFEAAPERLGDGRLSHALRALADDAAGRIRGAAGAALAMLGAAAGTAAAWPAFGEEVGSWVDACADAGARQELAHRLQGALAVSAPQLEGNPAVLRPLLERVVAQPDEGFLTRAPALRDGFDVLSPAARDRLFAAIREHLVDDGGGGLELAYEPATLAAFAEADRLGLAAIAGLPDPAPSEESPAPAAPVEGVDGPPRLDVPPGSRLSATDRFRLILGRGRRQLPPEAQGYARALDQLYGQGRGEGSRGDLGGRGGGNEDPYPTTREWSEDLSELFGAGVREEVLGRAAARGDANALLALDPDTVTPSVALLEQVLSLKGGLGEDALVSLRKIVARVVRALTEALAVRVRPALTGLALPRPTRRPTRRLDLHRTVRANLARARKEPVRSADGAIVGERVSLVPEQLVFRTRGRKSMDWRIVLLVDTSGSMDANVVHSAMMAAILSGLPAVHVHFLAFSTRVVDLSERVDDPLGLLMEVRVGGGTHIGKAVRYARGLVAAPTRTILCVVSDFEEGGPVPMLVSEVRALAESGVKLLGLAALDDRARPNYNVAIAEQLVAAGMPVAALTPVELARWVAEQIA